MLHSPMLTFRHDKPECTKWACSLASMDVDPSAHSSTTDGLRNLEGNLKIKHAQLITNFEKLKNDDPEHACCSYERLCLRKKHHQSENL